MKSKVLCITLSAAVIAAAPAFSTEAPALQKPPSPRKVALKAVSEEAMAPFRIGNGNPIPLLDKLVQQPHSPATRALLMKAFGVPAVLTVKPIPAAPGTFAYTMHMPAQAFTDPSGESTQWTALNSKVELDSAGRNLNWTGSWPSLKITEKDGTTTLTNMTLNSQQQRTSSDLWIGNANINIAQIGLVTVDGKADVQMEGLDIVASFAERGKLADISYEVRTKAIKAAGEQLDNFKMRARLINVDYKAFEKLNVKSTVAANPLAAKDIFGGHKQELIAFARNAAAQGTALEIDEMSASFHGHQVLATGRVSLAPVVDADFANGETLLKKVAARFDIKAPVALITEIAAIVTRKQAQAKGQPISEAAVAQTSQMITDGMVGKMVSSGYVNVTDGMLTSTMQFKGGKLIVNNKVVDLPKSKPAAALAK